MTELDIIMALASYGDHVRRYELMLPNVYTQHDNEADLFGVRKSGLCDEFEVKISRSDFLADKKKFVMYRKQTADDGFWAWHERESAPYMKTKYQALLDGNMATNYFWYVTPEDLVSTSDIPEFAGLIHISESGQLKVKKSPDRLHKNKMPLEDRYKLARKSTYRFWDLKKSSYAAA